MNEARISILDDKHVQFRKWLDSIVNKRGLKATLTISQIYDMFDLLDSMERKMDDIILKAFDIT